MKTSVIYFLSAALVAITTPLQASTLTVPTTFSSGTPAVAAEVNGNFTAAKTAVDDNDSRITALETAPATGLNALSCSAGQITQWDGGAWVCSTPTVDTNTDALSSLSCSSGQVAQWDGAVWACAALPVDTNTDTLSSLSCAVDEVVKWDGAAWVCSSNASSLTTEVQVETVAQLFAALTAITDNSASKPYVIRLAPGVYDVSVINMKPWVSIVGAGQKSTFIQRPSAGPVIEGADDAELRSLSIVNPGSGSSGGSGISCNGISGSAVCTIANTFKVKDVEINVVGNSSTGVYINNAAMTVVDSNINVTGGTGLNATGIYTLNTNEINLIRSEITVDGSVSTGTITGLLLQNANKSDLRDVIITVDGSNALGIWAQGSATLRAFNTDITASSTTNGQGINWASTGTAFIERSSVHAFGSTSKAFFLPITGATPTVDVLNSYVWGEASVFDRLGANLTFYSTLINGGVGTGGATCVGINQANGARTAVACQ